MKLDNISSVQDCFLDAVENNSLRIVDVDDSNCDGSSISRSNKKQLYDPGSGKMVDADGVTTGKWGSAPKNRRSQSSPSSSNLALPPSSDLLSNSIPPQYKILKHLNAPCIPDKNSDSVVPDEVKFGSEEARPQVVENEIEVQSEDFPFGNSIVDPDILAGKVIRPPPSRRSHGVYFVFVDGRPQLVEEHENQSKNASHGSKGVHGRTTNMNFNHSNSSSGVHLNHNSTDHSSSNHGSIHLIRNNNRNRSINEQSNELDSFESFASREAEESSNNMSSISNPSEREKGKRINRGDNKASTSRRPQYSRSKIEDDNKSHYTPEEDRNNKEESDDNVTEKDNLQDNETVKPSSNRRTNHHVSNNRKPRNNDIQNNNNYNVSKASGEDSGTLVSRRVEIVSENVKGSQRHGGTYSNRQSSKSGYSKRSSTDSHVEQLTNSIVPDMISNESNLNSPTVLHSPVGISSGHSPIDGHHDEKKPRNNSRSSHYHNGNNNQGRKSFNGGSNHRENSRSFGVTHHTAHDD